jgi:hypothetical protein
MGVSEFESVIVVKFVVEEPVVKAEKCDTYLTGSHQPPPLKSDE